jgi:hypothetical protein
VPSTQPLASTVVRYAHGALWVAQPGQLWRVPRTGDVTQMALPGEARPTAIAETGRWLWLAAGPQLIRVEPGTGKVSTVVDAPSGAGFGRLLGTADGLYAAARSGREVTVLDPTVAVVGPPPAKAP